MRISILLGSLLFFTSLGQAQENIEERFPAKKGNLRLSAESIKMNYVKNTEIRSDSLFLYNAWDKPMELNLKVKSPYLECRLDNERLLPGQSTRMTVRFDAVRKQDFGYSYEGLMIRTNDTLEPEKYIFFMAYIEEDFSGLTDEQRANAPAIKFREETFDFGTIKAGQKIVHSFEFTNVGKSDLIIRKTKASCGCTATEPQKTVLKPGEKSFIDINFDSTHQKGKQHKSVFVFSNDPRYANATLFIEGVVE